MEDLIIATAIWGNWPKNRIAKGERFTYDSRDIRGKGKQHLNRGGREEMQSTYIRNLAAMVRRNINQPYRLIVFADDTSKVPQGIEAWPLQVPYYSRAMPKAYIYGAPNTGCPIPSGTRLLVLDLDIVITGPLDPLVDHGEECVARERKYRLPIRDPDGDITFIRAGSPSSEYIAKIFQEEMQNECANTDCGDDRLLFRWAGAKCWVDVCPGMVNSYKWGRQQGFDKDVRIVSFHGKPLPDQANDRWVHRRWK